MQETVLHGRYVAAYGLSERERTKGQETVAVQGLVSYSPHLQLVNKRFSEDRKKKTLAREQYVDTMFQAQYFLKELGQKIEKQFKRGHGILLLCPNEIIKLK